MIIAFALAGLLSGPATKSPTPPDPNKKVCRKVEVIGSNLPNLECRTAAEWSQIDGARSPNGQDKMQFQRMVNQGSLKAPGGG